MSPEPQKNVSMPLPPLAPARLGNRSHLNEIRLENSKNEVIKRCNERLSCCEMLRYVDPNNPTWILGIDFFNAFPEGQAAVWKLFNKWGVFDGDFELNPPRGTKGIHLDEIMDMDQERVTSLPNYENLTLNEQQTTIQYTEAGRIASHNQYDNLKNFWLVDKNIPILARDYIQSLRLLDQTSPICLIGMSIDEVATYYSLIKEGVAPPLIGINKGFSPSMETAIESGKIIRLDRSHGEISPKDLEPGKVYAVRQDITKEGLPIEEDKFVIGMLYVWHHIDEEDRLELFRTLAHYAKRFDDDKTGLAIFEPLNSRRLLRMVLAVNSIDGNLFYKGLGHETAAFDALVGTTIGGGQTPEKFENFAREAVPDINWRAKTYPERLPQLVSNFILPHQQVGLTGF